MTPALNSPLIRPSSRLWIGAPALVVLACVAAPAAGGAGQVPDSIKRSGTPDLGWVVEGGVTHSVQQARTVIAQRATFLLSVMERAGGAGLPLAVPSVGVWSLRRMGRELLLGLRSVLDQGRSNHPSAAP